MWFLWMLIGVLIGFLFGFFVGLVLAVWSQCNTDKEATNNGVIKLCGKIYTLQEIDP